MCDFERNWFNRRSSNKYKYLKKVFEILYKFIDRNREYEFFREQICALHEFFKRMKHKERANYVYHAVLLIVRRNEIDWASNRQL